VVCLAQSRGQNGVDECLVQIRIAAPASYTAVYVMRVLTGQIEEVIPDDGKDPAAKALGKKGGGAGQEHDSRKARGDREEGRDKTVGKVGRRTV